MILEIVSIFAEILTFFVVIGGVAALAILIWAVSTEGGEE
jgi:hypothetical protein